MNEKARQITMPALMHAPSCTRTDAGICTEPMFAQGPTVSIPWWQVAQPNRFTSGATAKVTCSGLTSSLLRRCCLCKQGARRLCSHANARGGTHARAHGYTRSPTTALGSQMSFRVVTQSSWRPNITLNNTVEQPEYTSKSCTQHNCEHLRSSTSL